MGAGQGSEALQASPLDGARWGSLTSVVQDAKTAQGREGVGVWACGRRTGPHRMGTRERCGSRVEWNVLSKLGCITYLL